MKRVYLSILYEQKDRAKKIARDNSTRLGWEPDKKMWYWEGEGELPSCLQQFSIQAAHTKEGYRKRERSWNRFLKSSAGERWVRQQDEIVASEFGYESVEEMEAEEDQKERQKEEWESNLPNYHTDVTKKLESLKEFVKVTSYFHTNHGRDMVVMTGELSKAQRKRVKRFAIIENEGEPGETIIIKSSSSSPIDFKWKPLREK